MYYLHNTDLGFAFKNRGSITIWESNVSGTVLDEKLKQIPELTEVITGFGGLIPIRSRTMHYVSEWDEKSEGADKIEVEETVVSEEYAKYYEIKLIEGEMLSDNDDRRQYILINESAAKAVGWKKSTGKSFDGTIVKGVVKNIYNFAPTVTPNPIVYVPQYQDAKNKIKPVSLFKFREGTWNICKEKIEQLVTTEFPEVKYPMVTNAEEIYESFLKSENTLLKILTFVSLICIIICVFGFVSLVSLTCEERRKEIAIRKINGATVKDILDIFFKEYVVLLVVGAVIAFPVGYLIMKRWLEDYVVQTPISAWVYALILLMLIFAIVLCVGWKVYKTSIENPAEVIKKN
jgi:ABC-type antimicrobial peptide transport system permease subunit